MNRNNNSSSLWQTRVLRYGLAFVAVAAAFGLRAALTAWIGPGLPTYITFYPAVMVAALLAGFGPGLLATALTGLLVAYWILPPEGFTIASPVDRVGLVLFAGMGLFMSAVAELYRRNRRKAAAYDREIALRASQDALRQSEARLAGIVGSAMDAIISVDADQRIVLFNAAAENMFRCSAAEALGQPLDRFIPARHRARHREHVRGFGATGVTARTMAALGALSGLRTDGQEFPIEASISQGDVKGQKLFTVILRDITKRKQAEEALQKAHAGMEARVAERTEELHAASRYARSLLEASPDSLVTIGPDGKITDVNEASVQVTGVPREQLIGTDFSDYFTQPDKAREGYRRVFAESFVRGYPLAIRHVAGRVTDVLYNAAVYRNEAGEVQGVFAAARDVTELKEAGRRRDFTNTLLALFARKTSAQEYLDSAVEAIREWTGCQALGVYLTDKHGEAPYESWAGFDPAFIESARRLSPQRNDRARPDFASFAIIPIRYSDELAGDIHLADRRPGRVTPAVAEFIESMSPLIGEAVHRFQAEAELAKHRERLEELVKQRTSELERSNRDLEQFAYVASHDLQEPLRAVAGYVELLQHRFPETLDSKAREYVAGAADGAERMRRLIADLLAFSRVGTRGGAFVPTDLNTLLRDALNNLQASITEAGAQVTSGPLPSLPVDALQIVQLFQNLIGNAIKFHSERAPEIQVGAREEKEHWLFWVRDNGIGIEPQYSGRIFQIFQRLHTRKRYPGTGIGLAICKKIVERHGGSIWVESQPAQGSIFYFSIPEISAKKEHIA